MVYYPIHNPLPQFFNYEDNLNVVCLIKRRPISIPTDFFRVHSISEGMNLIIKQGEIQNIKIIIT